MKRSTINEQKNAVGGRWKCDQCGKKTLVAAAMSIHLIAKHASLKKVPTYHWVW